MGEHYRFNGQFSNAAFITSDIDRYLINRRFDNEVFQNLLSTVR